MDSICGNPGPKRKSWKMMLGSSTSEITRKWGHLGWILGKTQRRKQEEKVGLLGDFSGDWQPDLLGKIDPEPKVRRVFWESFLLQSWIELKTLLVHIKWAIMKVICLAKIPLESSGQRLNSDRRPCLHSDKKCHFYPCFEQFLYYPISEKSVDKVLNHFKRLELHWFRVIYWVKSWLQEDGKPWCYENSTISPFEKSYSSKTTSADKISIKLILISFFTD